MINPSLSERWPNNHVERMFSVNDSQVTDT